MLIAAATNFALTTFCPRQLNKKSVLSIVACFLSSPSPTRMLLMLISSKSCRLKGIDLNPLYVGIYLGLLSLFAEVVLRGPVFRIIF